MMLDPLEMSKLDFRGERKICVQPSRAFFTENSAANFIFVKMLSSSLLRFFGGIPGHRRPIFNDLSSYAISSICTSSL